MTGEGTHVVVLPGLLRGGETQDLLLAGKEQAEGSDNVWSVRDIAVLDRVGISEHPVSSLAETLKGSRATDDEVVRHRVVVVKTSLMRLPAVTLRGRLIKVGLAGFEPATKGL